MRTIIRLFALSVALGATLWWFTAGANRGWTKTSIPKTTIDEVTGIEGIVYEERFVPGLDFLGAALLGAGILAGISIFLPKHKAQRMNHLKNSLPILLALVSTAAIAEPRTFDFKDPKGVNNVVFKLDAPLEAITGSANGITGSVEFDPENPARTSGKIAVATSSLHVPNPMMKDHLHGAQWMDVSKHPEIVFTAKQLQNVKTDGDNTTADLSGTLTIRNVSKEVSVPVKLAYLKDKLGLRVPNQKGDLLVIRSSFSIKRSDYGINPGAPEDKVADAIDLSLSIAGASPR